MCRRLWSKMGGDCEDLSILLAGVLDAAPFDYEPILIFFSGRVGVGVQPKTKGVDADSLQNISNRDYVYLDASTQLPIGTIPEEYREPGVITTYAGDWHVVNFAAFEEHIIETVERGEAVDLQDYV